MLRMMQNIDDITYHIYLKEKPIYWNLSQDDFEEKWQMLNVMIDLISKDLKKKIYHILNSPLRLVLEGQGRL